METREMKKINIFLASSDELRQERLELADFVEHLNNTLSKLDIHIQLVKWEYLDSSMGELHKQEEYNQALRDCDICMVIYWNNFGTYTHQELNVAYNELCAGRKPHKLYVYFKDTTEASDELISFRDSFTQNYGHFYCHFENIDTLKADFILQFMEYQIKEIGQSIIEVRDSKVMIGNKEAINLNNVPFAGNNDEYQQLQKNIERTRKFLRKIEPDDPDYTDAAQELQDMLKRQQQIENSLWDTALLITQLGNQKCSERLERAMELFKAGDNKGANAILNIEEIEKDIKHNLQLYRLGEEGKKGLEGNVEELRLKIKTLENEYAEGWMEEVEKLHIQILEITKKLYGEGSEQMADAYLSYGGALHSSAKYKQALKNTEKALAIWLAVYGDNHPDVAVCYNNIGMEYGGLGNHQKSLEYFEKALAIWLPVYGDKTPNVATFYNNIGNEYYALGDYQNALEYLEKALAIYLSVYGDKHPELVHSYNNIGMVINALGDHQKALEYLEKALAIWLSVYGDKHPNVAQIYNNIGMEISALGNHQKALGYLEKALAIWLAVYGDKHPNMATYYNNIGNELRGLGDHQKALEYFEKALAIWSPVYGDKTPNVATFYNNIGNEYYALGDHQKALEYLEKALAIYLSVYGDKHPDVAQCYNNIGMVISALGDHQKALEYKEKAQDICKKLSQHS